jgi:DNA (cytosine-5)-methyltransferase 1
MRKKKNTLIDLFCGCGGISLGFQEAGFSVIAGLDNWEAAMETYKNNFPKAKKYYGKIEKIDPLKMLESLSLGVGELDVLVGGPPCQGFSLAGNRKQDDPRNNLVYKFIEFVKIMQPKAFLMENVLGILSMSGGRVKKDILDRFKEIGYKVDVKPLYAHHFGVPQMRRRVFFVGNRLKKTIVWPETTHYEDKKGKTKRLFSKETKPFVTVGEAISDLPLLEKEKGQEIMDYMVGAKSPYQGKMRASSKKLYNHVASNHSEQTKKVIVYVPEGGNWRDLPKKFQNIRSYSNTWRRLHSKAVSVTIDCGHRHHFHYKANRVPTVRESARIQSFPDRFRFFGSKTSQFAQVGNAVPPLLVKAIAKEIKKII